MQWGLSHEDGGRDASRDRGLAALVTADIGSVGLPVSVQVIGRPGRDHLVLAAMAVIEAATRRDPDHPVHQVPEVLR